jgi:hypothetical protein
MSPTSPFSSHPRDPNPFPFPTRGVPEGWRDPWDADPYDAVLSALRQHRALRRRITEAEVHLELLAQPRADGRWEAHVVTGEASLDTWPSVNGPTARIALDALEAELRELLVGTGVVLAAER